MRTNQDELMRMIDGYLAKGKLLHLATISNGIPWLCHVWYAQGPWPNSLVFTSNRSRRHSIEIASGSNVAGGIVAIDLEGLGQKVQGVSFEGRASEASREMMTEAYEAYASRWPRVRTMFSSRDIETGATNMRMYVVRLVRLVFFDEINFPDDPRKELVLER